MVRHPRRLVALHGASNFRDLGGYPGQGGRPLRWGRLFRSDHLAGLDAADREQLAARGLARTLDFRGHAERAAAPYELPGVAQHVLAIEPTVVQQMREVVGAGRRLTGDVVAELMCELYRGLVHDQAERFAEFFEHLLHDDSPVVFHCTAGKDRTGFAAALLLLALGVPRELVMADYLLTNEFYRPPPLPASDTPRDALAVLWSVQPSFLEAALQAIERDHGGVERYLSQRLGLGDAARATLARRFLQEI